MSEAASGAESEARLVRALGVRQLAASIFNYTVGSGIFSLPAYAVAKLGGAAPLAYLVCALVMALVVLCFAEAGSRVSLTGGPYAYVEVSLGPYIGFIAGALLFMTGLSAGAAVSVLFARSVAALVGTHSVWTSRGLIVLVLGALVWLNVRGVRIGARLIEFVTIAKLVPLIAFVVIGAAFVQPRNLAWGAMPSLATVLSTSGLVIFAFSGVESALAPSGEVRAPARTVPRAVFLALGAATLLYLAIQWVALGIMGQHLADNPTTPLADAAGEVAGPLGRLVLLAGASVSMFGYLSSNLLSVPRSLYAFARDGFLPQVLGRVHREFRTPHVAILIYALLVLGLAVSGTFERLALLSNLMAFPLYMLCAVAVWVLRRRDVRSEGEPFLMPGGPMIPVATCLIVGWLICATAGREDVLGFGCLLVTATALYGLRAARNRRSKLDIKS